MDLALEANREAEVGAGGKQDHASACGCCGFDGAIDCRRINRLAVANGAEFAHVEDAAGGSCGRSVLGGSGEREGGKSSQGYTDTAVPQKIATHGIKRFHFNAPPAQFDLGLLTSSMAQPIIGYLTALAPAFRLFMDFPPRAINFRAKMNARVVDNLRAFLIHAVWTVNKTWCATSRAGAAS